MISGSVILLLAFSWCFKQFFYSIAGVETLLWVYVTLLGLILGSFAALCAVRLPQGESVVAPRSHCRSCASTLRWFENIPILSYFFLRGKCRKCGERISPLYPLVEALTLGLTLWAFWAIHPWPRFLLYLFTFLVPVLILIFSDIKFLILPDAITLPGIGVGWLVYVLDRQLWPQGLHGTAGLWAIETLVGSIVGGMTLGLLAFIYSRLRGEAGLGGGDIKMAAMLGAFLGWKGMFFVFFLSSLLGLVVGVLLIALKRGDRKTPIPYGACLGAVALAYFFYGNTLEHAYFKLIRHIIN